MLIPKGIEGFCVVILYLGNDVELKAEWKLLPADKVNKIDFEVNVHQGALFTAISNKKGNTSFYQANILRNSSLHQINLSFVKRFARTQMLQIEEVKIKTDTLDNMIAEQLDQIDIIDINVEGHDFQVLQGDISDHKSLKNIFIFTTLTVY